MKKLLITTAIAATVISAPALAGDIGCQEGNSMYTVKQTSYINSCLRSPHAAPPAMGMGLGLFGPFAYAPERRVIVEHPRARYYAYEPGLTSVDEGVKGGND